MKAKTIRTTAVLLLLATVLSILPIFGSTQSVYSTSSNSGERDVICTTLDGTGAEDYYGNDYSYDRLSELSANYLYDALADLMTDTHKRITTYANCRDYATITDCENGDGRVMLIYTSYSANGMSDYTNNRSGGWNREHVWPKSLGGFNETGAGADLHHIRPSDSTVNSIRNNRLYGNINGGTAAKGTAVTEYSIGGYYSGNYFEPLDNVKGDVARICLYVYVRWAKEFPECDDITNVFQNVDVLLEWCALDPVDTWEMGRNEVVGSIQGNRNVFVDYPEYAWLLFDREIPENMITPSGEAAKGEDTPSCSHTNTEIRGASAATCGKSGFTGDTYCKDCGEKILTGKSIAATGNHSFGEWKTAADGSKSRTCSVCGKVETNACAHDTTEVRGAIPPTCKDEGYTGDTHCKNCDKLITAGTSIPVTDDHAFGNWSESEEGTLARTCSVCGKVETKACPHDATEVRDSVNATCKDEGYTGDTYCTDCGAKTAGGTAIPVTDAHSFSQWITDKGAKSRTCSVCEKTETIPCPHENEEKRNAVDVPCAESYSGDTYCIDCGELLEKGMAYPPVADHQYHPYTGRLICTVCGYEPAYADNATNSEKTADDTVVWIAVIGGGTILGGAVILFLLIHVQKKRRS